MHIQWFTTLVTETSCVIVNGFWAYWTPQKNIKNDKKKTNLNLLSSFKVSKFQESSTTYLSKHHTLITNSKNNSNRLKHAYNEGVTPYYPNVYPNPNYSPICILSYRLYSNYSQGRLFLATSRPHKFMRAEDEGCF